LYFLIEEIVEPDSLEPTHCPIIKIDRTRLSL